MNRKESEKYLNERQRTPQPSLTTSYTDLTKLSKYRDTSSTKHESFSLLQPRKRVFPQVLKATESLLMDKQERRSSLQESKEMKNLHEYVEKLQSIEAKRHEKHNKLEETLRMKEKK